MTWFWWSKIERDELARAITSNAAKTNQLEDDHELTANRLEAFILDTGKRLEAITAKISEIPKSGPSGDYNALLVRLEGLEQRHAQLMKLLTDENRQGQKRLTVMGRKLKSHFG